MPVQQVAAGEGRMDWKSQARKKRARRLLKTAKAAFQKGREKMKGKFARTWFRGNKLAVCGGLWDKVECVFVNKCGRRMGIF